MNITLTNVVQIYEKETDIVSSIANRITALKNIKLQVTKKSLALFLGPSGSGKTSLLNIISTFVVPTAGKYQINDINPFELSTKELQLFRWKKIGYLQQNLSKNFIAKLSLRENISFLQSHPLISVENFTEEKISGCLIDLGLDKRHLDISIELLSVGEQQRVAFLLLLLREPELILLDEPTSFCDEENRDRIINLISNLNTEKDITFIITSHDEAFIRTCSPIYIIDNGEIKSKDLLQSVSSNIGDLLNIPCVPSVSKLELTIPNVIFQQMVQGQVYNFKITNNQPITLQINQIESKDFEDKNIDTWFFLKNQKINISKKFQSLPWNENKYHWNLISGQVYIEFE
ncbi:MAG: ATP-binding cassette domain-containing protein [Candidatus Hodarchaeales archaeon]|jgi:ABC-type lipoprotein export system ATPase subunit